MTATAHPAISQTIAFVRVSDLANTERFYTTAFGLKRVYARDGKVIILQAAPNSFFGFVQGELPADVARPGGLTLIVPDADAWWRLLEANGVPNRGAPIYKPEFGIYVIYITDPDGYTVEVMEMRASEWPAAETA